VLGAVVLVQLGHRALASVPYIVVGRGLATESFRLAFLDPLFDPWFYGRAFLGLGTHLVPAVVLAGGLFLSRPDRGQRYVAVLLFTPLVLLTLFLANASGRYAYFLQPFLFLGAVGALSRAARWARREAPRRLLTLEASRILVVAGAALALFASTNRHLLQLDRLGAEPERITQMLPETQGVDYRAAAAAVGQRMRPDDVVIALMPHAFEFYARRPADYYLQPYTNRPLFYDVGGPPGLVDKFVGRSVLRNLDELLDVVHRHRRVWFLATPYSAFVLSSDAPTREFVERRAVVVYEGYNARVYLWES
jgi:hypothetical protein